MAIPISEYIDIHTRVLNNIVGNRDFSGLVFTGTAMKSTVPSDYSTVKTAYDAGTVVSLDLAGINACFESTADVAIFAAKYFGYTGGNRRPPVLNLAKVLTTSGTQETAKSAYDRVIGSFGNFGACTFLGNFTLGAANAGGLLDVSTANEAVENGHVLIVADVSTNQATTCTALNNKKYTHVVIAAKESNVQYGAWMPMAWYASVNYDLAGASGTIDYKIFPGAAAEVTSKATKTTYDTAHANYIGKVQVYGDSLAFYQQGANMDGTDLGCVRDACWLNSEVIAGWFNLVTNVSKVPANTTGLGMVNNLLTAAAMKGIKNGAILCDKPLSDSQISTITAYTQDALAYEYVQSQGYFIDSELVQDGDRYVVQYTLVYAKGDHIGKVSGDHILV